MSEFGEFVFLFLCAFFFFLTALFPVYYDTSGSAYKNFKLFYCKATYFKH